LILKRFVLAGVMLSVLAFVAVLGGADPTSAGTFTPTLEIVLDDPTPETPSGFTSDFGLPKGDVNFAGVVSFIAYALVLAALERAPAASVAAVRETSVLFVAALAAPTLGERVRPARLAGAALVVGGISLLVL